MSLFNDILFEVGLAARAVGDAVSRRSLRLGVTGLSRSGKTVFITALVNNLLNAAKLPVFQAAAEGRIVRVRLEPQPDDDVPRFPYEEQWARLSAGSNRSWPLSTRTISQLRLVFEFERARSFTGGASTFTLDIVDYPGEWLLDLSLLNKSYADWSAEAMTLAEQPQRSAIARDWLATAKTLQAAGPAHEDDARRAAEAFTGYLRAARDQSFALSTLPPGRFLMPGDLEGSPALTFAPLWLDDAPVAAGSLAAMMARRYEAYRNVVVRPFFSRHFARLDRQIVLIDALAALNSGPAALRDLEYAMTQVLLAFRTGRASLLGSIFRPRVDRILIAATKADHLHHASHDRLEAIVRLVTARAIARATGLGAQIDVVALAAVRATREAEIRHNGEAFQAIVGVPEKGESLDGQVFDGVGEVATFPGQLPDAPELALSGEGLALLEDASDFRFLKFRPPLIGASASAPSIRLDRAMQFLLGDRLA